MYRLDQIQADVIRKVNEEIKDDKVHRNKDIYVKNNKSQKPYVDEQEKKKKKEKKDKGSYCIVDGTKYSGSEIEIKAEFQGQSESGIFIDKKK